MLADCVLLAFYRDEVLEMIERLQRERSRLRIHVLHNASSRADILSPLLEDCLQGGAIDSLSFFHRNIASAAYGAFFDARPVGMKAPFVIVSDGDILPEDGWLDEITSILTKHEDVFSAGVGLHELEGLPNYIPPTEERPDYFVQRQGWCLKTFRAADFHQFMDYRATTDLLFHDAHAELFGRIYGKHSVRTKHAMAENMRLRYLLDHGYQREKQALGDPWDHGLDSPFTFKTRERSLLFPPMPVRRFSPSYVELQIHNPSDENLNVVLGEHRRGGETCVRRLGAIPAKGSLVQHVFGCHRVSLAIEKRQSVTTQEAEIGPDRLVQIILCAP